MSVQAKLTTLINFVETGKVNKVIIALEQIQEPKTREFLLFELGRHSVDSNDQQTYQDNWDQLYSILGKAVGLNL